MICSVLTRKYQSMEHRYNSISGIASSSSQTHALSPTLAGRIALLRIDRDKLAIAIHHARHAFPFGCRLVFQQLYQTRRQRSPLLFLGLRLRQVCRRSEEHTSELQSLMRISYAAFCLTKKKTQNSKSNDKS